MAIAPTINSRPMELRVPIIQAGMGGGISRHELAGAVSEAGGLGTICMLPPEVLAAELEAARRLTAEPIAVNLLLPFAGRRHYDVAQAADVVVTFWGRPKRVTAGHWIHQSGSVEEALAAQVAGADGVIVQGVEAGGHVRGSQPAYELLERVRAELPTDFPLYLAGGIATAADVGRALEAGARAAVAGTRFLLSDESHAHARYKQRLIDERETELTTLFGLGWPRAPHRVVPNEALRRWGHGRRGRIAGLLNTATGPLAARLADRIGDRLAAAQSPDRPFFSPLPPTDDDRDPRIEAMPLYAGESVSRIHSVEPAARLIRDLTP